MESLNEVWENVINNLSHSISEVSMDVWIANLSPLDMNTSEFVIMAPNAFTRNTVVSQFTAQIEDAIKTVTGLPLPIRILIPSEAQYHKDPEELYEYTFENFIVGASNQFAYAAANAVVKTPGTAYNPLLIYGNSGLGKTHLLMAISAAIKSSNPNAVVTYIKGDQFTNELIESIKEGKMVEFHSKYRYTDVFLVDDVQFMAGKESTQEEFFHTFNTLFQDRKQIVMTSDRPPKDIKTLDDRLRSRFEHGVIADIQPPDYETRMAIIKRKAQMINLDLSDDVCAVIADNIKSNIRQIEGVVKKMSVICMVEKEKPNYKTAQTAIKDVNSYSTPPYIMVERIITEVSRNFDVSPDDIRSHKRNGRIPLARQVAMYVMREVQNKTYKEVGEQFGNRDHTTVIYSINQVEEKINTQPDFKANIEDIIRNIRATDQ